MCACPMGRQHAPGASSQARVGSRLSKLLARRPSYRTLATA